MSEKLNVSMRLRLRYHLCRVGDAVDYLECLHGDAKLAGEDTALIQAAIVYMHTSIDRIDEILERVKK